MNGPWSPCTAGVELLHKQGLLGAYDQASAESGCCGAQFEDDVYIATSEPHGDIEATITRGDIEPHCKL